MHKDALIMVLPNESAPAEPWPSLDDLYPLDNAEVTINISSICFNEYDVLLFIDALSGVEDNFQ